MAAAVGRQTEGIDGDTEPTDTTTLSQTRSQAPEAPEIGVGAQRI